MSRPITTLEECADAYNYFADKLESGEWSQERVNEQSAIVDKIVERLESEEN